MSSIVPQYATVAAYSGLLDLTTVTLKVMLLQSTYTPNKDHKFVSQINTHEATCTGYVGGFGGAGRKALTGVTITEDTVNDRAVIDAADPSNWTLGGGTNNTLLYAAIIREITNDAASIVLAVLRFENTGVADPITTNGSPVGIQFSTDGLVRYTH